jgi:regulator of replication initiation timing
MSLYPAKILLPLIEKLESGMQLSAEEIDTLCEAARTLMQENLLIPMLREQLRNSLGL